MSIIEAKQLGKSYHDTARPVTVLEGLDLSVEAAEGLVIFGASGSGKSTLLHLLGGLDRPTAGQVNVDGTNIADLNSEALARYRNRQVGFVFQFYHLLPEFTALENTMLPVLISGGPRAEAEQKARGALEAVGLKHRVTHRPGMLSGGEQQRVALARAVVMRPKLILADEPTGNLDRVTGDMVWRYLIELKQSMGIALVIATHNRALADSVERSLELRDGKLWSLNTREA